MAGGGRHNYGITTDLLTVWTDPDTAMEAVGRNLGIFGEQVANPHQILNTDPGLSCMLYGVLLKLVDGGVLEKRPCGGGRHAFRWQPEIASATTTRLNAAELARQKRAVLPVSAPPVPTLTVAAHAGEPAPDRPALRPLDHAALLLISAMACAFGVLAFLTLSSGFATAVAGGLTLAGVIGLIRRVPFAGAWTTGIVIAGCLWHFS